MGQQSPNDAISGLPTGATLPMTSGALPQGGDRHSIQVEQGVRHEDATAGVPGTNGNMVSPYSLQGFTPLALLIPNAATRIRIRTNGKLIYGFTPTFNVMPAPQSGVAPVQRAAGSGHARLDDADGWRELPVAGMDNIFFQALDVQVTLYFEFLVLSNL